jgi:hypothetical protein
MASLAGATETCPKETGPVDNRSHGKTKKQNWV